MEPIQNLRHEVDIEEVEYLRHAGKAYFARVFRPRGKGPFPAVVEAHGGAWCDGDRRNNDSINRPVAEGGIVVAALDFRCPPEASYPGSVADFNYGIRWLKAEAARFATRPELVGSMGTSRGAHLAVLNGLKPRDPRYTAHALDISGVDASTACIVALWPVICPWSRWRASRTGVTLPPAYAHRGGALALQQKYWLTEEAMAEGSPALILERGERIDKPDILYVQNPADALHSIEDMRRFADLYRTAGGEVQVELVHGDAYDLVRTRPESVEAKRAIRRIIDFIHSQAAKRLPAC